MGIGTARSRGVAGVDFALGEIFLPAVFLAAGLGLPVFFATVFLGLGVGLGMDFYLLVQAQSLDTRKYSNLNQFTYYSHYRINKILIFSNL
jgi:hypothetical protein